MTIGIMFGTVTNKIAMKYKDLPFKNIRPESLMMSFGYKPKWSEGALKCPIFQTSTFVFNTAEEGKKFFEIAYGLRKQKKGEATGLIYSRLNNPDLEILEDRLTLWDEAEAAAVFESGMAAIGTSVLTFARPGDVILHNVPLYGGTDHLFKKILPLFGIESISFTSGKQYELKNIFREKKVKIIYIETPANPTNDLIDIERMAKYKREYSRKEKPLLMVDNTFLGPLWQHPLKNGADMVLYSATKFIGGHSDVIAGVCLGTKKIIGEVKTFRTFFGSMSGPWTGWLLLRSLETLKLRMTCQMKNAQYVADFLADHPKIEKVYYLGNLNESEPQYKIYQRQCLSPGSMISFDIKGGENEAFRFLNNLKLVKLAVSLGSTESLASHPATMTHSDIPVKIQNKLGITPKMIRLSVGVENPEDLITDLKYAMEKV